VKLLAKAGVQAEEKDIRLEEPIKSVGTHEIPIHIWGEHYAGIQIVVEAEAS
jgi:ribosomal protein L9